MSNHIFNQLKQRQQELFQPIDQQIMMTDDINDLLLLSTNMLTTSIHIFCQHYGKAEGLQMIDEIIKQYEKY
jgi:hypothetical protein